MVVNMLKAISRILLIPKSTNQAEMAIKMDCARVMLEEIVSGMKGSTTTTGDPNTTVTIQPSNVIPPTPLVEKKEPKYMIRTKNITRKGTVVRVLEEIKGLDKEALLEIDGKRMPHHQAIGQEFKRARILP